MQQPAPLESSGETQVKPDFFLQTKHCKDFTRNLSALLTVPQISMCSQGHCPGEKSSSNGERSENCARCSGRAVGLVLEPGFRFTRLRVPLCFIPVPQRAVCGVYSSWDYRHRGMWMSAGETEDFRCIQDISVLLITLQGFYCKLLLWFPAAVRAHRFGARFLQEL